MKATALSLLLILSLCAWAQEAKSDKTGRAKSTTPAKSSNQSAAPAKTAQGGPAEVEAAIQKMENELWTAWKNKDSKPFATMLANDAKTVDAMMGFADKAAMVKSMADMPCEVRNFSLAPDKITWIDKDAVIYTYTATVDATCGGQKVPDKVYAGSVWAKRGAKWVGVFHQETPSIPIPPPAQ
jgi:ketosteroid isomerase-like protein